MDPTVRKGGIYPRKSFPSRPRPLNGQIPEKLEDDGVSRLALAKEDNATWKAVASPTTESAICQ
jgi:hypothetical protein